MAKEQTIVKLAGYTREGKANTSDADRVTDFKDINNNFEIMNSEGSSLLLTTSKGQYTLTAHPSIENLFTGICAGTKVHFTKKRIVGKLIYWS